MMEGAAKKNSSRQCENNFESHFAKVWVSLVMYIAMIFSATTVLAEEVEGQGFWGPSVASDTPAQTEQTVQKTQAEPEDNILGGEQGFWAKATPVDEPEEKIQSEPVDEMKKYVLARRLLFEPYKFNYFMPYHYLDEPDQAFFEPQNPNDEPIYRTEIKFQISVKVKAVENVLSKNDALYVAYSQVSFWQAYEDTAYFRESNYEPEIFMRFWQDISYKGWGFDALDVGLVHQSNGEGGDYERSWNRIYVRQTITRGSWYLSVEPWLRIDLFGERDYNSDIEDYLGYGKVVLGRKVGNHLFYFVFRNVIESGFSRGAEEFNWAFPIYKEFYGFVQLFSGYGEGLSEYNHYQNSIGLGVALWDWL